MSSKPPVMSKARPIASVRRPAPMPTGSRERWAGVGPGRSSPWRRRALIERPGGDIRAGIGGVRVDDKGAALVRLKCRAFNLIHLPVEVMLIKRTTP
ncbi:hypothetical protein [Sphingopyxis sp. NJF-3]